MRQRYHGNRQFPHPEVRTALLHFKTAQFVACVVHHAIDFFLQFRQAVEMDQNGARTGEAGGRLAPLAMQNRIDDGAFFVHPIGGEFDDWLHHVQIIVPRLARRLVVRRHGGHGEIIRQIAARQLVKKHFSVFRQLDACLRCHRQRRHQDHGKFVHNFSLF